MWGVQKRPVGEGAGRDDDALPLLTRREGLSSYSMCRYIDDSKLIAKSAQGIMIRNTAQQACRLSSETDAPGLPLQSISQMV